MTITATPFATEREYHDALISEAAWHGRHPFAVAAEEYHARGEMCPFDCAACDMAGAYDDEDYTPAARPAPKLDVPATVPVVTCGHCHGKHTIAEVRACSLRTHRR